MSKKKIDGPGSPQRTSQRPADTSPEPLSADLTIAEILAQSPPAKPRKPRKRETAKSLGVFDADRDILDQYLYEVSQTPLLTAQQEVAIARRVRAGDEEAMQELVKRNLRFVISVAKKYQNRGMALTDLIGEGNVGLLTAARKFDPDQGVKFISYAVWWIRQAILASLARQGRTVRVPLNRTADLSRIVRTAEQLRQDLRREPTPEELRDATGLALDVVQSLAALNTADVRLDAPIDPEGDRALIDRFIADELTDAEAQAMDRFLSEEIEAGAAHAGAARRQGAAALFRPRWRPGAHPGGDRRHARRHPGAGAPAARPRAEAAAGRGSRKGAGELRRVTLNGASKLGWR